MHQRAYGACVLFVTVLACSGGSAGPGSPPALLARTGHAMAYDAGHHAVVLFGGLGPTAAGGAIEDQRSLWSWNGQGWSLVSTGTGGPSPRNTAGLVFDAAVGRLVVFSGRQGTTPTAQGLADTWEWNGAAWSPVTGSTPGARVHFAIAYDAGRLRTVLYGGFDPSHGTDLQDVWERNGSVWGTTGVMGRDSTFAPVAVYDATAAVTWIFVSRTTDRTMLTYAWNGDSLHLANGAGPALTGYAAAPLVAASGALVFGGSDGVTLLADTWRWDGSTWTKLAPSTAPPGRIGHAMALDAARGKVVLYGGETQAGPLSDTWEFDGTTWTHVAAAPPAP